MNKKYIYSAILGGTFFAVPYLALNIGILPSALIGIAAYGTGVYMGRGNKKDIDLANDGENMYNIIKSAKEMTIEIKNVSKKIEDESLVQNINEIYELSNKIIDTLSRKPEKLRQVHNFLNYYLPVTLKILNRYDEIENQKLNTKESQKFMETVEGLIIKIKKAFKEQLNNMYQSVIIDTDAEMKVFEGMLKADGFIDELKLEEKGGAKK